MSVDANGARLPEKGLGLALDLLEEVARSDRGVTAADIARAVGAPRATVYRVVNSLVRDEFLVRRPDLTGFLLGTRVLELASLVETQRRAGPATVIERLREQTGEGIHLFGFHRSGVEIVDEDRRIPLADRETLLADPARSAIGHLWLVDHTDRVIARAPRWLVRPSRDDIAAVTEAYAVRGYTEQAALLAPDRACIAVPINDAQGVPIGAVSLSTSTSRLSTVARHVATLRDAADELAEVVPASP